MVRKAEGAGFRLTDRDLALLEETYLATVIGIDQYVSFGLFSGVSRARRRLAKLEAAGCVRRYYASTGQRSARSVFAIGSAAVGPVCESSGLDRPQVSARATRPFARTLVEHSLMVGDVRAAFRASGLAAAFTPEPLAREEYGLLSPGGTVERKVFRPDGLFLFSIGGRKVAGFLEADRGSVSLRRWAATMAGYRAYLRLGLFSETYGEALPVVLVVTTTRARIAALSRTTAGTDAPPVYYATSDDLGRRGTLGKIWRRSPEGEAVSVEDLAAEETW